MVDAYGARQLPRNTRHRFSICLDAAFGLPVDRSLENYSFIASQLKRIMQAPSSADFLDSHHRHWEDADLLFRYSRLASADQLFGYSTECGLKAVMKQLGMPVDKAGRPQSAKYRKHVDGLWQVFKSFAHRSGGRWYLSKLPSGQPFGDWSSNDRYANRVHFGENRVSKHRDAALAIRRMVQDAKLYGQK